MTNPSMTTDAPHGQQAGRKRHIAVIGGGITGLAAAHHLIELANARQINLRVTLYESGEKCGGAIRTVERDGFLLELGPDNFITNKPGALALCKRIGLEEQLLATNAKHRRAMVVRRGKLMPIPEGFELMAPRNLYALARSPIFSWRGKLRMGMEQFIKAKRDVEDESLESFVVRRFGREALDRLIQPLIGGIYTADPSKLSLRATVPRFLDMEAQHGSIIAAMRHEKKQRAKAVKASDAGARYSLFMTLRDGMQRLPDRLVELLGDRIVTQRRVASIETIRATEESQTRYRLQFAEGSHEEVDAVIVAAPAQAAAGVLHSLDAKLADELSSIEAASSAIVLAGYRRDQVAHALDAFGFVVPSMEKRSIIAGSFSHVKYDGRAPKDHVLLRAFVGGAMQAALLEQSDDELIAQVQREFEELLGVKGQAMFMQVQRWPRSMPQYHVGHVKKVAAIRQFASQHHGLALAGSSYDGVGIPDCITSAAAAALRVMAACETMP